MCATDRHPLCLALRSCLHDNDGASADNLQALLECNKVYSVATYAVTPGGGSLYMQKPGRSKTTKLLRAFGGCEFANNLVVRMNSLRLELMDEGSILWQGTRRRDPKHSRFDCQPSNV